MTYFWIYPLLFLSSYEDAPAGIESAHAANMKCLAVITPYVDLEQLRIADTTVESLETVNLEKLAALVRS